MTCLRFGLCLLALALPGALGCSEDSGDTSTTHSSTTGSGGSGAAGGAGGAGGEPIEAPADTWTWVPFADSMCGTGTPTGIGIHPTTGSTRLLIYLQGGGVCIDQQSCLGPMPSASHFNGFGPAEFDEFKIMGGAHGPFDQADTQNPFREFSYVFVPYCTGDVHAGNMTSPEGLNFVGHANLEAFLNRIVPTFPALDQVVLTGTSAGGFGAMYNFYMVQNAFEPVPAVLIDDSGPFLPLSATPQLLALKFLFGLDGTIPPGCDACLDDSLPDAGLHQLIPYYAQTFPGRRGSLISSLQDQTIVGNFNMQPAELEAALNTLADNTVPQNPDFRVYYLTGNHHVWLFGGDVGDTLSDVVSSNVTLAEFLRQQIEGDAAWASVRP
jgi:hypothetical protein